MGDDLCQLVKQVFRNSDLVETLNETYITLIPKLDNVSRLKDFKPIGLCNVSYKIITKILAQRLRPLMEKLVSPCQASFIPNRQSGGNTSVAQEVFHSMRSKKGKTGWMTIKVDLEKAYDCLKLDFVRDTLVEIRCPSNFFNLIWCCISYVKMRML